MARERFRQLVEGFEAAPLEAFVHQPGAPFETSWSEQRGEYVLWTAWAGGPKAKRLAPSSEAEQRELALASLTPFLAGEATDHEFPGTVAGALASGLRAARQALHALTAR